MTHTIVITVINADVLAALRSLPDKSVQIVITSPPYLWLRNYGVKGQIGLEKTPAEFIAILVAVFREIWRVLRDDGTVWLNMGDSYAGSGKGPTGADGIQSAEKRMGFDKSDSNRGSQKYGLNGGIVPSGWKAGDLRGMPWRLAFALQDAGWWLRTDIIWHKPNPMPESNKTRPTRSHEFIFLLTKSGSPLFWTHPERDGVRKKPAPDYIYHNRETMADVREEPAGFKTEYFIDTDEKRKRVWVRRNQWIGWNYFYDKEAIKEPVSESYANDQRPLGVLRQKCNNKSKYPNEGQFQRIKKQDALGNPQHVGFNARWKGNRKTFRGGGKYTEGQSFDNSTVVGNQTHGNDNSNPRPLRNKRDVWRITTKARPEAHFASFPDELPQICIAAGTSEYGCCPACGAPYMRVLKKVPSTMNIRVRDNAKGVIDQKSGLGSRYKASEEEIAEYSYEKNAKCEGEEAGWSETVGWRPTCECQAGDPVPCVTLDPFMGRGTVALVSREMGRSSIGIDLNPEYCELARLNLMGELPKKKNKKAKQKALDTGVVQYDFKVIS